MAWIDGVGSAAGCLGGSGFLEGFTVLSYVLTGLTLACGLLGMAAAGCGLTTLSFCLSGAGGLLWWADVLDVLPRVGRAVREVVELWRE